MFSPRYVRNGRAATNGNSNMVGSNTLAIHFNFIRPYKLGKTFNKLNAIAFKTALVTTMNALNIGFPVFYQPSPVKAFLLEVKTVRFRILNGFGNVSTVPHDFFRYTANVNASATNGFCFNYSSCCASNCGAVGRGYTTTACANT